MALTTVDVPTGSSVQIDDGTHLTVYVVNLAQRPCVVLPSGAVLGPAQTAVVPVTSGVPVTVASYYGTTVGYASAGSQPAATYARLPTVGTLAAQPAASTFGKGYYFATDDNGGTLYYSDATAWTKQAPGVSSMAFGARVAQASITGNFTTTSTSYVDVTALSATWTAVASALYRVRIKASVGNTVSAAQGTLALTDSANTVLEEFGYIAKSNNDSGIIICESDVSPSAGSVTYKGRLKASASTAFVLAGATFRATITVDRVG